ncbi:amidohydrolase family protein [Priestia taiwanensis]|uniref:Deaminase n=1 Tax=Priestia taiwanensis TaxID=1347902 RepID=A0A917EPH0_9BACI|nr:amidohydrolase family protein [Priestia taiwanensis]MBM7363206.1 cytosine/adenosine deaminase-related metal-dependent hydrolase [Priestia taiwanensis]GGE68540.1 deaminase [Priestia taiwanensis]
MWLTNVRLESGYRVEDGRVTGTNTELCHLLIEDGNITKIIPATESIETHLQVKDARGLLALPPFKEMHNHLDKTYLGGPWKSCTPVKSLSERLQLEAQELPILLESMPERAEVMLQLFVEAGVNHVRTHVNIDPYIGLKNLEAIKQALTTFEDKLTYEIVAFPQHGLLHNEVPALMRQAMREGATLVGGLDPAGIDKRIEAALHEMMDIAVETNADIDMHLHDPGHVGWYTIKQLTALTREAKWHNRVAVSHAFSLGDIPHERAADIADELSELGMSIMSTAPVNRVIPPVPLLRDKGVTVALGCDGFYDSWAPFGSGDMLEKAYRLCERYRWVDEHALSQSLSFITGGITPLTKTGERMWPKIGDEANIVFADASCSAEVVARRAKRPAVMYKGNITSGSLERKSE